MPHHFPAFTLVYLAACSVGAATAALIWTRRSVPGARALALTIAAAAFWAACDALELHATTVASKRLVSQVQYLGVVSAAPFFFHAAVTLAGRRSWLTRPVIALVWSIPLATLAVAWTSQWHTWLWREIVIAGDGSNLATYRYGWWFWLLTADHYVLLVVATLVLLGASRRVSAPFRVPLLAVVAAALIPWVGNIAYVFKLGPYPGLNWLSVSVIASGLIFAWIVGRAGLFDPLPYARDTILERMPDAVLVVDLVGTLLYRNPATERILGWSGRPGDRLTGAVAALLARDESRPAGTGWTGEVRLPDESGRERWLDVAADVIGGRWDEPVGRVFVIREVTARKAAEAEREGLIADLEHALSHINVLEGLLPICANCKRVRDPAGGWSSVEEFVSNRAPVEFSHGICPECMRTLYGDSPGG